MKMIHTFIDCGAHLGESIEHFRKTKLYKNYNWKIYSFEPHPILFQQLYDKYNNDNEVSLYNKAIWIEDTKEINFYQRHTKFYNNGSSSLMKNKKTGGLDINNPLKVSSINFTKWLLSHINKNSYNILKIDIEGAEYDVLNNMLKTDVFKHINHLFIEFHNVKVNIPKNIDNELMLKIKQINNNIKITTEDEVLAGEKLGNWFDNIYERLENKHILIGITRNHNSIHPEKPNESDPRNDIFIGVLKEFLNRNYNIYLVPIHLHTIPEILKSKSTIFNFDEHKDLIDCCITWQGITNKSFGVFTKEYKYLLDKNIPCLIYEHGPLYGSLLIDRQSLSDSKFVNNLQDIIQNTYNDTNYNIYKKSLLSSGISKRIQANEQIPIELQGKFIFVPHQKITDFSVLDYSETGMIEFINKVFIFCKNKNIPMVIKLHPHAWNPDHNIIKEMFNKFKKEYNNIYLINGNIYNLCKNALFTATINSGSMVDNFIVNSLVYSCGKSMYYKTNAIYYNNNVEEGLDIMLSNIINKKINTEKIYDTQNKIVWWLKQTMLFKQYDLNTNIKIIDKFLEL
tara:strand:+ start:82 stop:1782 length:1701 start_codon:yes stop_codon:yes gene_type:complete